MTPERIIRGNGTPERVWQPWLEQAAVPVWLRHPGLDAEPRVVVVAPHPDDEVLACGGLLAQHAAHGGSSLVVSVTDGEASHDASALWSPLALAAARRGESTEGLLRLGLRNPTPVRLALPDGAVTQNEVALCAALMQLLLPGDIVVTTWQLDGHPDHDATGRCTAQVCKERGCNLVEAPVWMWHWGNPDDRRIPWHRLRCLPLDPTTQQQKQDALAAHASQLGSRGLTVGPVLGPAIIARSRRSHEYFFL